MARVCVGRCGLTSDGSGNLIVNTSGTWPYACPDTNGLPIMCDSSGELRVAQPQKSHIRVIQTGSSRSGEITSAAFGSPVVGGAQVNFDTPVTYTLVNPSSCLPMTVAIRHGVHHAVFRKDDAGDSQCIYGTTWSNSIDASTSDAHQQWRESGDAAGNSRIRDTMNSTVTIMQTLPAGGSVTYTVQPYIQVQHYNGNTSLSSFIPVLDVEAWH